MILIFMIMIIIKMMMNIIMITIITKVKALVQGRDRRPDLAYKLALECRYIPHYHHTDRDHDDHDYDHDYSGEGMIWIMISVMTIVK